MMRSYYRVYYTDIFFSPEDEVDLALPGCGFPRLGAAERGEWDHHGRPGQRLALPGHRTVLQGRPPHQDPETGHWVKVSPSSWSLVKQIIRSSASSVVTSVTIVESRNYVGVKQNERNKKPVKKRPDKTPRFEFYLYNDAGRIIKQYLTIHEIQQILLQQSQSLGPSRFD